MAGKHLLQAALVLLIGAGVGLAGSHQGESLGGLPLFLSFVIIAYVIQWIVYVPSFLKRTEHYFDLTGSITYQLLALFGLLATKNRDARTIILALMVWVWAFRLGTFLFKRVKDAGRDGRFDQIKNNWAQFLMVWTLQGLWITFTAAAAWAAITSGAKEPLGIIGIVGIIVWLCGFGIEVMADRQKSAWRADSANAGRFITGGLWSWSRHPNYFGEFLLWVGVAIVAIPVLQGWQFITLISPIFVYLLLTKVSGLPMLEKKADKKWGGQDDYEKYKAATPAFFLRPPR